MTHVPYKSTAQSIVDVASGVIQLQLATISPTLPLYQSGKVRILGIASDQRSSLLPEVPTLAEQGAATQAGFSMGLVVPTGTPELIVERLNKAVGEALEDEQVRSSYFKQGVQPRSSSPEVFGRIVQGEIESYRKILNEFGIASR
jgi:tripartite-type tricarboxylate transporter receptor subunit TctC